MNTVGREEQNEQGRCFCGPGDDLNIYWIQILERENSHYDFRVYILKGQLSKTEKKRSPHTRNN